MPVGLSDFVWALGQRTRVCLSTLKLNQRQDCMGRMGIKQCWEMVQTSGTRMILKTLLITSLLGWARCQESQIMTAEEKTAIR